MIKLVTVGVLLLLNLESIQSSLLRLHKIRPPPPKYASNGRNSRLVGPRFDGWREESGSNIWEHSGLYEGDIMTYNKNDRNGIINTTMRWPDGIIPFVIDEDDFEEEEIETILHAIKEYHNRTCIKFREYQKTDKNWIVIKGNYSGCWSSVGMHDEGQVVNLSAPRCVKHGVTIHELMHAAGFFHQQSASNRDNYVKIMWENISDGHEFNFNKYNETVITDFGEEYDYSSIMHYSSKAFSKNNEPTIVPLDCAAKIGQREGLSEKDVSKLNNMYAKSCNRDPQLSVVLNQALDNLLALVQSYKKLTSLHRL